MIGTEHFTPEKKGTQKSITREQAPLLLTPSSQKSKRSTGRRNLPLRVSGAPALALPEKCEKVKSFMQTNVRLPPDSLAGASQ